MLGMFRTMWSNMDGHPTAEKTAQIILRRQTVEWPTDSRLKEQILSRSLYGSAISRYAMFELDRSFGSDQGGFATFTIEHVAPQNLTEEWRQEFSDEEHASMVDLWANLIPLTQEMNGALKQSSYSIKRAAFRDDLMFSSARRFAKNYNRWDAKQLQKRGLELVSFAASRWPRPKG